jgi:hypothetical protein
VCVYVCVCVYVYVCVYEYIRHIGICAMTYGHMTYDTYLALILASGRLAMSTRIAIIDTIILHINTNEAYYYDTYWHTLRK